MYGWGVAAEVPPHDVTDLSFVPVPEQARVLHVSVEKKEKGEKRKKKKTIVDSEPS